MHITASDIEKLAAWISKRWPSEPAIDQAAWLESFDQHQPRHFEHACRVFSQLTKAPTIPSFALACLTIGFDLTMSRAIVPHGFGAWRQYWKDKHAGEDAIAARRAAAEVAPAAPQQTLF